MSESRDSGSTEKDRAKPAIVLFSVRERVRDILTVGLVQCDYRIIPADSSYLAAIKASQFLPDLIIIDITTNNTNDIHLITRLQKSLRTRSISVLVILPGNLRNLMEQIPRDPEDQGGFCNIIEYPFNFADLLLKIRNILFSAEHDPRLPGLTDATDETVARQLLDVAVPVERKLGNIETILVHKQWAFPFTVIRALNIIESDASCCGELAQCINVDPGASTAILKVANTVYYAKRQKRITDIKEAVVRLGFRETRNLLACMALINLSPELYKSYGFVRYEFWLHSLACGLIAEKLCADAGYRRPEIAFIAGLIHDLGKIPIDNNFSPIFLQVLEQTASSMTAFFEIEHKMMGFSHATLGHYLTKMWNFPDEVSLAILNHHNPRGIELSGTANDRMLQGAVYVANICSKMMSLGHSCDEIVPEIPSFMLKDLQIPRGPSDKFIATIHRNLHFLCKHLDIALKNLSLGRPNPAYEDQEIVVVLGKGIAFHPLMLALANNGYTAKVTNQFVPEIHGKARCIISIPEKGYPLDIMLYGDEINASGATSILRIFLLDVVTEKRMLKGFDGANIMLFDKQRLDMRVLLNTIDGFLDKVVTPQRDAPTEPSMEGLEK